MFGFDLFVADIYRAGREADRSGVKRRGYPCPPSLRRQHTGAKRRPQDTVHVHRGGGGRADEGRAPGQETALPTAEASDMKHPPQTMSPASGCKAARRAQGRREGHSGGHVTDQHHEMRPRQRPDSNTRTEQPAVDRMSA